MSFFISILVPIRDEELYIGKCLTSLLEQDYDKTHYEILVVDGMSTDKTREVVKEFEIKNKNVTLLNNPNRTVPYALNIGIKHAAGNVIVRVDGHAIVEKDYLRKCTEYLESTKAECVGGVIESINETFIGKAIALAMSSPFGVGNARFRTSGKEGYVDCLAFGAYRGEVFEKIGLFDEEFVRCQDDEFNYRLRKYGGKIFLTPHIKAYYYPRSNLKKLWQQYFQYGFWKIRVLQKHFSMMQPRQFVPPLFVLALLGSLACSVFYKASLFVFVVILMSYSLSCLFAALRVSLQHGRRYFLIVPSIFMILHISYGLGFLWGIVKFSKLFSLRKSKRRHSNYVSMA